MRRPVVGITAALESAAWTIWRDMPANISSRAYSLNVSDAGGLPVVLPADEASEEAPDEVLDILDALVLAGGADLDPASYGAEPSEATVGFNAARDRFELALARRAIERDMPVLGICRGMQLMNVACGGTLIQDLANRNLHVEVPGTFSHHGVKLEPGSLARRSLGADRVEVHSHHHQGLDRLGENLEVTGWAEEDGLVEAIEMPGRAFVLGLMWHPEEERESRAIKAVVEAARLEVSA